MKIDNHLEILDKSVTFNEIPAQLPKKSPKVGSGVTKNQLVSWIESCLSEKDKKE